jgi:hypothetical protein
MRMFANVRSDGERREQPRPAGIEMPKVAKVGTSTRAREAGCPMFGNDCSGEGASERVASTSVEHKWGAVGQRNFESLMAATGPIPDEGPKIPIPASRPINKV